MQFSVPVFHGTGGKPLFDKCAPLGRKLEKPGGEYRRGDCAREKILRVAGRV